MGVEEDGETPYERMLKDFSRLEDINNKAKLNDYLTSDHKETCKILEDMKLRYTNSVDRYCDDVRNATNLGKHNKDKSKRKRTTHIDHCNPDMWDMSLFCDMSSFLRPQDNTKNTNTSQEYEYNDDDNIDVSNILEGKRLPPSLIKESTDDGNLRKSRVYIYTHTHTHT
eukprot:GHVR01092432.1.p1 GENE.GHVR01092432.1~~GHVR01092432.1.p1  ORF type:complete len:181 (+),score=64.47 GHVR01092432.1:39-545(+)